MCESNPVVFVCISKCMICIPPCRERSEIANQDIQFSAGCRSISFSKRFVTETSLYQGSTLSKRFTFVQFGKKSIPSNISTPILRQSLYGYNPIWQFIRCCRCQRFLQMHNLSPLIYRWPFQCRRPLPMHRSIR